MQEREERIVVETVRHRLTGTLRLAIEGYGSRLTDRLNASEREFLALTDVEIVPLDGGPPTHRPFVAVGRRHVVFATPADPAT